MYRQSEKNLLNSNISPIRPYNMANSRPLTLRSVYKFGAPQLISTGFSSCLRYCSDVAHRRPTKLCTTFGRLLSWYTIHTLSGALAQTEICPVQNSLYVQVLRSPILAALLHGTPAAGVSQTLWRGTRNGITELSQRAPPISGWEAITLGIGPHSSCIGGKPTPLFCVAFLTYLLQFGRGTSVLLHKWFFSISLSLFTLIDYWLIY